MASLRPFRFILVILLCFVSAGSPAEPLRVLVPLFEGPKPLSQHIQTTLYLELSRAFRAAGISSKGAWMLFGPGMMREQSHQGAIDEAGFPSRRADLVIWGQTLRYDEGAVAQLYLTITPQSEKRVVRPELWTIKTRKKNGEEYIISLDLPIKFFDFEPITIPEKFVIPIENLKALPIYNKSAGGERIGSLGDDMFYFVGFDDEAILVQAGSVTGWVRAPKLSRRGTEAIAFAQGIVRLLRGDWIGSKRSLAPVTTRVDIPQRIRSAALMYVGLAKEKLGKSGRAEIESARKLNLLDRAAASYLLMSGVSEVSRTAQQRDRKEFTNAVQRLRQDIDDVSVLFDRNDNWFLEVLGFLRWCLY